MDLELLCDILIYCDAMSFFLMFIYLIWGITSFAWKKAHFYKSQLKCNWSELAREQVVRTGVNIIEYTF